MLSLTGSLRVFVCRQAADMRRSFDGLCGMVEQIVQEDPLSGHLFVFRNRNRDRLKILYWDRDGLAIWYKRLEAGTWQLPTDVNVTVDGVSDLATKRAEYVTLVKNEGYAALITKMENQIKSEVFLSITVCRQSK